ncbi:MAG: PAS domain S-box protein, partial [Desulfobacteraceae bacterium]|nr:PAS domain S-box protein [Desulfobacteraceae bacterium]
MSNNNSHIKKLEHEIEKLQNEAEELKYAEKINQVLFEISNAVNTTIDLTELYKSIHGSLKKLLPLPNFFISIVDREKDLLHFPYHQDSEDSFDGSNVFKPRSFKIPSLTREVIIGEKPLFLTKEALEERDKKGTVCGTLPEVWIGAPLFISGKVIGVMAMYSYDNPDIFTQQNMDLFISISNQVALAIDRKYAIEKLRDNEETFRALIENSNDIVMRFDRLFRHLYVSPSVRTVGLEPEDMIEKTHAELGFPPELINQWEKEIENVFVTKKSGRIEFYLPQGIWFDWLLSPEFSSKGEVIAVITSARDITERKRLELQRTSLNKINQIIISSTNIDNMFDNALKEILEVFVCDRAWVGHFNLNTHNFKILNEYTLPEWPGALAKNIQVDMSKKAIDAILKMAENGGLALFNKQTISMLNRATEIEHEVKSMMLLPVHIEDNVVWLFGLHQCSEEKTWTFTEQDFFKQIGQRLTDGLNNLLLQRKLRDAKNYIDSIIDSMPSLLIGVNAQLEITGLNSKAKTDAGVTMPDVEGNKLYAVFPNLEPHLEKIMQAIKEQKIIEKTKIPRHINGNLCYENITIFPLVDETVKGAVVRIDEVTEQVRLEEMMIRSEKMLSVGGLAAGMAHEINNP